MTVNTLNKVRYSGSDFDTALDELLSRLQVSFASSYNDFAISSLGIMLVDLVANGIDTISFFVDRRASDLYLGTARTRKSVARAARQLGYKMAPATAGSVDITIAPTEAQAFAVPLPIGFQVQSPDGTIWEAAQAYTWPISNTDPQVITFSQTQTLHASFVSDGTHDQVFRISNIPTGEFLIGPGTDGISKMTVTVDGDGWTEEELLTFGVTGQFEVGYHDTPPTLRFGDGIAGKIPPQGASIEVTFKTSRGVLGTVTKGQNMTPVSPLTVGFNTVQLTMILPSGSTAGSDPETIEKAKANAPTFFKSRGVNITKDDYKVRAASFVDSVYGAIAVASAVTVRGASSDAYLQTLLDDIENVSSEYVTEVASSSTAINSSITAAKAAIAAAVTDSDTIATEMTDIATQAATITTSAESSINAASLVTVFVSQIQTNAATLDTTVSPIATGGSDQLTSATKSALTAAIAAIQAAAINASSEASVITSDLGSLNAAIGAISTDATDLSTAQSALSAQLTLASTDMDSASASVTAMVVAIDDINNNVADTTALILSHVDSFLSSDCQTNLIEVPILTLDSDGFYAAPTIALVQSLQKYLDAKKETTQVVKVLSGASSLVAADISIHVGVLPGYVETTVKSKVEAATLSVLKQRAFGKSLKLSELYWQLEPETGSIDGISFVNVTIDGPISKKDGSGNISVLETEVVTRGTLTITSEIVTED